MIRRALLSFGLLLAGCSNLTEEEGGAVALQITQPPSQSSLILRGVPPASLPNVQHDFAEQAHELRSRL